MVTPTIAKTTFREVLFSPLYIVISLVGITAVILLGLIPYFTLILSDDVKMFKDVATSMTLFIGIILAVLSASKVIDEEIDNKTMLTLLSKPIRRGQVVVGKFFGVCAAVAIVVAVCGIIITLFAWWRPPWDENIPMWSQGVESFTAKINDIFNPTSAGIVEQRQNQWAHFWSVPPMIALVFLQLTVITAISVAVSTRLGMALNVMICAVIFVTGHMISFLTLQGCYAKYLGVTTLLTLIPQLEHYNITETLAYRTLGTAATPWSDVWAYVGLAGISAVLYCAAALLVGMALFRSRELA